MTDRFKASTTQIVATAWDRSDSPPAGESGNGA